jgi:poly [ADP-ribose] polymerase 2/3/4
MTMITRRLCNAGLLTCLSTHQTVASKLLDSAATDSSGTPINPLDARLAGLNLKTMDPLKRGTKEFDALEKYLLDSQGATHGYKPRVQNIFRIERCVVTSSAAMRSPNT